MIPSAGDEAAFSAGVERHLRMQIEAKHVDVKARLAALEASSAALEQERAHLAADNERREEQLRQLATQLRQEREARRAAEAAKATADETLGQRRAHVAEAQQPVDTQPTAPDRLQLPAATMGALVDALCSWAARKGVVPVDTLSRFLEWVDSVQPIGQSPVAKAKSLCNEFGNGTSISRQSFQLIVTKLAQGNHDQLLHVFALALAGQS